MANDTSPGPEPTRAPQAQRGNEADAAAQPARDLTPGQPQLQVQATSQGVSATLYEGDSPWQAMHRLSIQVNQDSPQAKDLTRITLTDQGAKFGVAAVRNNTGEMELQFQTSDAQALYRQVIRERQMELASPADNRMSAAAPQRTAAARKAQRESATPDEPSHDEMRRGIVDRLEGSEERASGNKPGKPENAELDRQVLERASVEQLRKLQEVARSKPEELGDALRKLQKQIEREVARDDPDTGKAAVATLSVGPPVQERFSVQERLGRRDYWLRDRPDRLGFTETWLSLRTKEHNSAALMGMVDRAVELGWKRLHLEGTPEFKREAWIIANSRGLAVLGYTATLGDREAAQAERKRLTGSIQERDADRAAEPLARTQGHAAKSDRTQEPTTEQLRQVVRKAIADGRVSPELEERLTRLLSREAQRRGAMGKAAPKIQTWDPGSPRVRAAQQAPDARKSRMVQRER